MCKIHKIIEREMPTLTPKPNTAYGRKYRKKLLRKGRKSSTRYAALFIMFGIFMLSAGATMFLFSSSMSDGDAKTTTTSWKEVTDKETGGTYFWNQDTGETTWRRPRELEPFRPPPPTKRPTSNMQRGPEDNLFPPLSDDIPPSSSDIHIRPIDIDPIPTHHLEQKPSVPPSRPSPPPPSSSSSRPSPPASSKCAGDNVMIDTDLRGGDMPLPGGEIYNVLSEESCCVTCRQNVRCVAWVYQSSSNVCYLKDRETVKEQGQFGLSAGRISGRKVSYILKYTHTHTHKLDNSYEPTSHTGTEK